MPSVDIATSQEGARFRALAEALGAIVTEVPAAGAPVFNPLWYEYTGLSVEHTEREGWRAAVHPDDVSLLPGPPDLLSGPGVHEEAEFRLRRADGQYRWHLGHAATTGKRSWLLTAVDIHDKKLAEEALYAAAERERALFTSLPALLTVADEAGVLRSYNQRWLTFTGMSKEEAQTTNLLAAVDPEDHKRALELWGNAREQRRGMDAQIRIRRADGMYRWHAVRAEPSLSRDGGIAAWVTTYVDIHEIKRAEGVLTFLACSGAVLGSSLHLAETLTALTHLAVPFLADYSTIDIVQPDGQLKRMAWAHQDPAIEAQMIASTPEAEEFGPDHPIRRVLRTTFPELITEDVAQAIAVNAEHLQLMELLNPHSAMIVPLIGDAGRAIGVLSLGLNSNRFEGFTMTAQECGEELARRAALAVTTAHHLEQAQRTADELRKANAVKDELLGLVSHELRTPLTTIAGVADVLRRRMATMDEETRIGAVNDIVEGAERLQRLIENMLVLSHVERGAAHIGEPVLLQRLIPRIIEQHRRRFPERKVSFESRAELPPVYADPTYVEQIVQNLLGNAEKYSPEGAPVEFVIERADNEAHVTVMDHGIGFTPEEADQIFEPFFRSGRIARSVSGAGLGLPVCRRLLEVQGGRIWAASREGGGAVLSFALPLAQFDLIDDDDS